MARIHQCDVHDTTPALIIVTVQQSGDVTFACTACVPELAAGLLMMTSADRDPGEVLADFVQRTVADALDGVNPGDSPDELPDMADPVSGDETDEPGHDDEQGKAVPFALVDADAG